MAAAAAAAVTQKGSASVVNTANTLFENNTLRTINLVKLPLRRVCLNRLWHFIAGRVRRSGASDS